MLCREEICVSEYQIQNGLRSIQMVSHFTFKFGDCCIHRSFTALQNCIFLPFLDQHYLLHGHSHFAFAGWITQALMTLMVSYLFVSGQTSAFKKYRNLLVLNLITAYGMVISFPLQGYGFLQLYSQHFLFLFLMDLHFLSGKT